MYSGVSMVVVVSESIICVSFQIKSVLSPLYHIPMEIQTAMKATPVATGVSPNRPGTRGFALANDRHKCLIVRLLVGPRAPYPNQFIEI